MKNPIYPCLTIKNRIKEAAELYKTVFNGNVLHSSSMVIQLELGGQKFLLLNDGPASSPTASISFMVTSESEEETERYWQLLAEGGSIFMPLDTYPWSSRYGWIQDKFGVSWQIFTGSRNENPQKFMPTLMFSGEDEGKAAEAIGLYTSLFEGSSVGAIAKFDELEGDKRNLIKHGRFSIGNFHMAAMDSPIPHDFNFTDAISFVVECEDQAEIDKYWDELTGKGGNEVACGWLTDRYSVSWQIIPKDLSKWMSSPDRAQRVMGALLKMKKLIIKDLAEA